MNSISSQKTNKLQQLINWTIEKSKVAGVVWLLQNTHSKEKYKQKLEELRAMPYGTVGKELASLLSRKKLDLIPKFETHDIKHLILDYDMTPLDEVRMQAYLLGNGNRSLPCLLFLSFGLFMPELWFELGKEYQKGKAHRSIAELTFENCLEENFDEMKNRYCSPIHTSSFTSTSVNNSFFMKNYFVTQSTLQTNNKTK